MSTEVVAQTLGALLAAVTFSVGFLSTRVHRERGRALDRVVEMEDRIAEASRDGKAMDAAWFDGQVAALDAANNDLLDRLAAALNLALGAGIVGLALRSKIVGDIAWSSSQGILLLGYVLGAVSIVVVGTIDFYAARRNVRTQSERTAVGLMHAADEHVLRAAGEKNPGPRLRKGREAADDAVRLSRGQYGPAWAVRGYAHLLSLSAAEHGRHDLLIAQSALERAADLGPETAPMRAALASVRELRQEYASAAANWVRALWLYHEAERPLAHFDRTARPTEEAERVSGKGGPRSGGAEGKGAYAWRFLAGHPRTLSLALAQLPPQRGAAGFTAQRLVQATGQHPGFEEEAIAALTSWLQVWIEPRWQLADHWAAQLLDERGAPQVRAALETFRSQAGPVGKAKAAKALAEARHRHDDEALQRRMAKNRADMNAIIERMRVDEAAAAERWAELQADEERGERIRRGEGTPEDHAAEERMVEEAVARAEELVRPDVLAAEQARLEREHQEWEREQQRWEREQAERDADFARMEDQMARLHRLWNGLATEADIATTTSLEAEGDPWPEPDTRHL